MKIFNLILKPLQMKHLSMGLLLFLCIHVLAQEQQTAELKFGVTISQDLKNVFKPDGRLFLYFSETDEFEPRYSSIYNGGEIFAKNISNWNASKELVLNGNGKWVTTAEWNLKSIPKANYYVQILWKQNEESNTNTPGNLYSASQFIEVKENQKVNLSFSKIIPKRNLVEHDLVALFSHKSQVLSKWWNKPMTVKASVLLPSSYHNNPNQTYPVRYNVGGYGGRYTRINNLVKDSLFMDWWTSPKAPQIITVFLDGEGPFGDPYQMDSDNSGPYGEALITELIPSVEKEFRINGTAETRFVDGCSTGGWVSLALQLFYPEHFNGCFSYSPDPVDFRYMQLINIYEDDNAFYNEANYLTPSMRDIYGNPKFSIKQDITFENVEGFSNTYNTSGKQWGGWHALFSPKGKDGLPKPLFDPITGVIDKNVATHWRKYDLLEYTKENWSSLGPKIQDKIYVLSGDMDEFYLNNAMRSFDEYLSETTAPKSNAEIVFSPMKGHCWEYSHRKVLEQIQNRLIEIEDKKVDE